MVYVAKYRNIPVTYGEVWVDADGNKHKTICESMFNSTHLITFLDEDGVIKSLSKTNFMETHRKESVGGSLPKMPECQKQESAVDHPSYYNKGIECIDYIESHNFDFCLGSAVKYITRAGLKTECPKEDLQKALWYVNRKLSTLK